MLKKLLEYYRATIWMVHSSGYENNTFRVPENKWLAENITLTQYRMCTTINCLSDEILKGQHQMYADYLMLELLERGEI